MNDGKPESAQTRIPYELLVTDGMGPCVGGLLGFQNNTNPVKACIDLSHSSYSNDEFTHYDEVISQEKSQQSYLRKVGAAGAENIQDYKAYYEEFMKIRVEKNKNPVLDYQKLEDQKSLSLAGMIDGSGNIHIYDTLRHPKS